MNLFLFIIIVLFEIYIIIRLAWGRSLMSLLIYLYVKFFVVKFKFKGSTEDVNKRIEAKRNKIIDNPKWIKKNESLKEYEFESIKYYCLNEESKSNIVIYYLHGGGFIEPLNKVQFRYIKKIVKETDAKVYLPLYPLIPNYSYKDIYPLVCNLYLKIRHENIGKKIIMSGDSAGGNIALVIAEEIKKEEQPDELILISPATTMSVDENDKQLVDSFKKCILVGYDGAKALALAWSKGEDVKSHYISPYYGDVSNLKNVTIVLGEYDMAYGMGMRMVKKLKSANVKVRLIVGKKLYHVWLLYPMIEAKRARSKIVKIIKR
ncbi:MAG: alpha/beta hydrolase fold domain-containing protein [Bacilli bacterium]|nr:alpha/beta hydrolase fold domain-containing protein [Bacilli bacterium]